MGRQLYIAAITALLVLTSVSSAEARSGRQSQVPHGDQYGCDVCHTSAGGLNDFGFDSFDYTDNGNVDWAGLAGLDSDRDGYPNGVELGDPEGSWSPGDPTPSGDFSNPGEKDDGLCGNGSLEGEEECESGMLNGTTCDSLDLGAGTLSCSDTCRFDTSSCDTCGDGTIQGGEECDGDDLAGVTCESLGLGSGTLGCTGCGYNTVGCSGETESTTPDTCGDGVRQSGEECDGSDLAGETCATQGFTGGTLGCQVRCSFDTSSCTGGSTEDSTPGDGSTYPSPSGAASSDSDETSPTLGGSDTQIELEGRACTTTRPASGRTTGGTLFLMLLGYVLFRRRRSAHSASAATASVPKEIWATSNHC